MADRSGESAIPRPRPDFAHFLETLCRQSDGDVHLDLAELDSVDVSGMITLIRAAHSLGHDRHLILHNPPASTRRILDVLGPTPRLVLP